MSYFTPDVIAREQLSGARSTPPTAPPPIIRAKAGMRLRRSPLPLSILQLLKEYLELKVNKHD